MKGVVSSKDESALSFYFVVVDTVERTMTVREVFWNKQEPYAWGESLTVEL